MNKKLEEVAVRKYSLDIWAEEESLIRKLAFSNGAKYMQEQMYNEIDIGVAFYQGMNGDLPFSEWFENFKKK